jgi:hypothetical protein
MKRTSRIHEWHLSGKSGAISSCAPPDGRAKTSAICLREKTNFVSGINPNWATWSRIEKIYFRKA